MALQFQPPPDWLIKQYMDRPNVAQQASGLFSQANTYLNDYAARKQQEQAMALKTQEMDQKKQEMAMKGKEQFYNYGDPSGLPPEQQSALKPAEGPMPEGVDQNLHPSASYDPNDPSAHINSWLQNFKSNFPQGIKGQTSTADAVVGPDGSVRYIPRSIKGKTFLEKPTKEIDQKKTFQLKGFLDTPNGKVPISYDTRTGELVQGPVQETPLQPVVAPSVPGAEVSKIGDLMNMKEKLGVLDKNYDPSFIGMLDAPTQALKQKTGFGASEKAAIFKQASQDIKDSLLRARSGAQINEQEYQRLLPIVPNETMSEVDFKAKRKRFEEVLNSMIQSKQEAFKSAGYRNTTIQTDVPVVEDGYSYTPGPGGKANQANWRKL